MKTFGNSSEILWSDQARDLQKSASSRGNSDAERPASPVQRRDKVQISDAGRALAAQASGKGELTPERIAEVRELILSGAYNSLEAVNQVARKMIASGDI
jgi:negative regulator of flagellin synthesis FlgM